MKAIFKFFICVIVIVFQYSTVAAQDSPEWQPELTETWEPVPNQVFSNPSSSIPSDAIILFNGTDLSQWEDSEWKIDNGVLHVEPGTGGITTKDSF
ncbi:MAG: DUF1080 domain-containing protein, partial [Bacteroidetes bacterium]|nr:DUF1080 domain-containing protein [Bacteroidota bacterium]